MIRQIRGVVDHIGTTHLIIDVHGVGYYVYASQDVLTKISGIGQEIKIYTYTHVREDILELYGFATIEDLKLFEQFIAVSGIGPKTAIGIFSVGSRADIMKALMNGDLTFFSSVPRLGKKNAQKLIIELKGKVDLTTDSMVSQINKADQEVINALKSFGFSQREIGEVLEKVAGENISTSEKIRQALRILGK